MSVVTVAAGNVGGTITLTDNTTGEGASTGISPLNLTLSDGDSISILALPDDNFQFANFEVVGSESGSTTDNPFNVIVGGNFSVTAYFTPSNGGGGVANVTPYVVAGVALAGVALIGVGGYLASKKKK